MQYIKKISSDRTEVAFVFEKPVPCVLKIQVLGLLANVSRTAMVL